MSKLSWLDRAVISIAPRWGLDRVRARRVIELLDHRHYDAAQPGRRTSGWARNASDANLTIAAAVVEIRLHARDLLRNNSWAKRGVSVIRNNTVGWGIVPKATGVDDNVARAAADLWKGWAGTTECETEGRHTFAGIQALAMRAIVTDGEVLIRRRYRRPEDQLSIPIQLQVLEADYIDRGKYMSQGLAGGPVINGVEFDAIGRRAAYWLFDKHPGSGLGTNASRRISADDIIHVFDSERPGQASGISWLGSAIMNLKDLDEYEDAELMKAKIAACFAAFVTDTDGSGVPLGEQSSTDPLVETIEPGVVANLPPGKQVTFGNPPSVVPGEFAARQLRRVAAGLGVTYEDLTGDYSNVNFSSARMARLAHWANVYHWQHNMLIPLLCDGVWSWAMTAAEALGDLPIVPGAEWTTPPMPMIEPDKEGLAAQRLVRTGSKTLSELIREQGGDPKAHLAEYAADLKMLDALGIKLDTDVRAVSQAGLTQVRQGSGGQGGDSASQAPEDSSQTAADQPVGMTLEFMVEALGLKRMGDE